MVNYVCNICNKVFDKKCNFINHTQKKKRPCSTLNEDIKTDKYNLNTILAPISTQLAQLAQINAQLTPINTQLAQLAPISTQLAPINTNIINNMHILEHKPLDKNIENINMDDIDILLNKNNKLNDNACLYCDTVFTRKTNLNRHMKERCKSKKYCDELELLKEKFDLIMKENELLKKSSGGQIVNNTTNNNNNTTNNNNNTLNNNTNNQINNGTVNNNLNVVQLVQFGNENMDDIDIKEAFNTYLSSTGGNIVSNVLRMTNFNKKYPENHNICITDLSRELVKIYNGTKFITKKFKNVKGDILNKVVKNTHIIVSKLENDKTIKKTQDFQSKMKINNVSLKLIDGQSPEDIVRDEIREKEKLLTSDKKLISNNKNNSNEINYDYSDTDSELEEEREFNFEERLRVKYLEDKQDGLINIAHERIKDELYNNKNLITHEK